MRAFRTARLLILAGLLLAAVAPATTLARAAAQDLDPVASVPADLVRIAWADVGVPTPFRVSTAGPGGATLLTLLYDTLTWKDEGGIIPWLATSWEIANGGLDYTFVIAPGVTWHDGRPLTADDVAFSFEYYAEHPYRWMSTAIVASAVVTEPDTVVVTLTQPYAPFLEEVAGSVPIVPRHIWEAVADPTTYDGADATVGSGPYTLAEYRQAEGAYRLLANPDYFRGPVLTKEIQQLNTPAETRLQAVQGGKLELTSTTDASVAALFPPEGGIRVLATPPLSIVRLAVNTARAPLDQPEVRQAIAYALDRAQIAAVVTKGEPIVGSAGVIPPGSPWFNPALKEYPFDPEAARALLGGQEYTIEILADPTNREPELMAPMLAEIGITLKVKQVDGPTRTQLLREGNFQLGMVQHIGVGGDPDFLRRWYAGEEANDFAQGSIFTNAEFAALGLSEAAATDPGARRADIYRMQEILAEELPTIVLYYRQFFWVYDSESVAPMNTSGGLMNGIPLAYNKLIFLQR